MDQLLNAALFWVLRSSFALENLKVDDYNDLLKYYALFWKDLYLPIFIGVTYICNHQSITQPPQKTPPWENAQVSNVILLPTVGIGRQLYFVGQYPYLKLHQSIEQPRGDRTDPTLPLMNVHLNTVPFKLPPKTHLPKVQIASSATPLRSAGSTASDTKTAAPGDSKETAAGIESEPRPLARPNRLLEPTCLQSSWLYKLGKLTQRLAGVGILFFYVLISREVNGRGLHARRHGGLTERVLRVFVSR